MRKRYSCGWLKRIAFDERKVPTTAVTSSIAGACMTSLFLQRRCEHPDRLNGSLKYSFDTVTLATSVAAIERFDICPACSRFQPDCHRYKTKRKSVAKNVADLAPDNGATIFLSEPVVLGGECKECGRKVDIFDLASEFDETLAECAACKRPSNVLRIVDSVSHHDLLAAFADKPLPVKFLYFNHNEQQFMLEMED
jgi:hypothetical protein